MSYSFYRSITIDHTKCGASDSTNFTCLVTGTYTYLATVANGGLVQNANGYDIAFFSDALLTSALNWEMVIYTAASGLVEFWVKVPTVSHTSDTVIYMAYSNATISTFQGGAVGTAWDQAVRIYHLPDGSSLTTADSSANAPLNTSSALTIHSATAVAGQIDGGVSVNPTKYLHDDSLRGGLAGTPTGYGTNTTHDQTPFTFSMWMKTTQSASNGCLASYGHDSGSTRCAFYLIGSTGKVYIFESSTIGTNGTLVAINDGVWHYIVGTAATNSGANNTKMYLDGVLQGTATITWGTSIASAAEQLTIGQFGDGSEPVTASIDEVHIWTPVHSVDWILAEYNNQLSPSTFYTVGTQTSAGPSGILFATGVHQIGNPGLRY